jgi:signal transduction histidine kinase
MTGLNINMIQNDKLFPDGVSGEEGDIEGFDAILNRLTNRTLITTAILAVPVVAASVLRALEIGWKPIMTLHIMLLLVLWLTVLGRRRCSYCTRVFVTERVRLEEMVVQSEKMLTVGGLAAGMAHEINNPLAGILQNIQVIQNRISPDLPQNQEVAEQCGISIDALVAYMQKRKLPEMMSAVIESGKRAATIIENMLSFSRKSEARYVPCSLMELLDKTVDMASSDYDLKRKYDFRQIDIVREYDPNVPLVPCEASKIQQVVLNILKNGAQAMTQTKGKREASRFILRVLRERNMARIEIEDNGPGMDKDTRKRVFEPFFTTKNVGLGTGLGLSVSYFIVTENHQGTMAVESTPGTGTKFIICLPWEK